MAARFEVGDASNTTAVLTVTNPVDVFGTLSGHGTFAGAAVIESGGTLAPGGTIGTLTINGSLVFDAGSFYGIELSPTQHSMTDVTGAPGTVTINGGTVVLTPHIGNYSPATITIVTSIGLRTGVFDRTVTYSGTTRLNGATLSYDAHDVFLSYAQTTSTLAPTGATINEQTSPTASTISSSMAARRKPSRPWPACRAPRFCKRLIELTARCRPMPKRAPFNG